MKAAAVLLLAPAEPEPEVAHLGRGPRVAELHVDEGHSVFMVLVYMLEPDVLSALKYYTNTTVHGARGGAERATSKTCI